jgi:hypothetical protein
MAAACDKEEYQRSGKGKVPEQHLIAKRRKKSSCANSHRDLHFPWQSLLVAQVCPQQIVIAVSKSGQHSAGQSELKGGTKTQNCSSEGQNPKR